MIHQIDSKNEWLLLLASFTAKFGLVFVLTLENALEVSFSFLEVSFSSQQKEHRFFYKTVLEIFKTALHLRDQHVLM